jgi:glutathione S-transferase
MSVPYALYGINPSPYSMKMRAVLRHRRLPFVWYNGQPPSREMAAAAGLPPVIPVLRFPDGTTLNDSTPLIEELERRHPGARSIVPSDPAHAFLAFLIEDMADEWLTKAMYHYRWWYEPDRVFAALWVTGDRDPGGPPAELAQAGRAFIDRQVGRMAVVGSTAENRPTIEKSYLRILDALENGVQALPFLFGGRPSLADFGLFGQLLTLSADPTPAAIMRERAPHVLTWLWRVDDTSGVEGDWIAADAPLPAAVQALLQLCGDTYLPFLAANAAAIAEGEKTVRVTLRGRPFEQAAFRYQAKCYDALRHRFAALQPVDRARVEPVLEETGCLGFLR